MWLHERHEKKRGGGARAKKDTRKIGRGLEGKGRKKEGGKGRDPPPALPTPTHQIKGE